MDPIAIAYARALKERNLRAWQAEYVTALDGCCAACRAGQPILYRYLSYWGVRCHVHTAPAWVPLAAAPTLGRSAL